MTLIIGIKCSDGVVLGADGAATFGSMGRETIRQPVTRKLEILASCIVVGVSGPVGLGQRFRGEIETLWNNREFSNRGSVPVKSYQAMAIIRQALQPHLTMEFEAARVAQPVVGQQVAAQSALTSMLVAMPLGHIPILLQFDHQGAPEELTEDLPFVTIGSGQSNADPFLAFVRRIFWPKRLPTVDEATFTTLWTLNQAIETAPAHVGDPKQIVVLEKLGTQCQARELAPADLEEHLVAIAEAENALARFKEGAVKIQTLPEP